MSGAALTMVALPIAVATYAYVVYPMLLAGLARGRKPKPFELPARWPDVSVVVPAYNEETQIAGALEALLAQEYPGPLQILVISDASTDATDQIVAGYGSRGVELLRMPQRGGKTRGENAAAPLLRGSIIVNTDASIRLHPLAIRELVSHMDDPEVGVASGRDVSISDFHADANITEAGYVEYEMRVRRLETLIGGIVGASGSCYAIRADLHRIPIRDDLSRDFSAALTAREHGYSAVSVDSAICFVPRTPSLKREFNRKIRTISRGMDTLYNRRHLLNPARYGLFAWKLWSHKVARWLLPVTLVPAVVGLILLSGDSTFARVLLAIGAIVGAMAAAGAIWPPSRVTPRLFSTAAFGVAANLAVIAAIHRVHRGGHDYIWEPTRRNVGAG